MYRWKGFQKRKEEAAREHCSLVLSGAPGQLRPHSVTVSQKANENKQQWQKHIRYQQQKCVCGGKVPTNNLRNVWSSWLYRSWVWTDRPPTQVRQQRIIKISKLIYKFSVISKIPSSFSIKTTWQLRLYEKTKTKNTLRGKKTFKMNVLCGKGTTPGLDLHSTWQSDHWLLVRRSGSIPSTHTGGLTQLKLQGI